MLDDVAQRGCTLQSRDIPQTLAGLGLPEFQDRASAVLKPNLNLTVKGDMRSFLAIVRDCCYVVVYINMSWMIRAWSQVLVINNVSILQLKRLLLITDRYLPRTWSLVTGCWFAKSMTLNSNTGSTKVTKLFASCLSSIRRTKTQPQPISGVPPMAKCYDAHNCFHCYLPRGIAVADKWLF